MIARHTAPLVLALSLLAAAPLAARQPVVRQDTSEKQCLDVLPPEMRARFDRPLSQVPLDIRVPADDWVPADCSVIAFGMVQQSNEYSLLHRHWAESQFVWEAADFWHQPLYFDRQPLERYGQTVCPPLEPVLCGVHFFSMFPAIPYKIGIDRTHDRIYSLGYYRPGSLAPCTRQRLPFEIDATAIELGTLLPIILLLP